MSLLDPSKRVVSELGVTCCRNSSARFGNHRSNGAFATVIYGASWIQAVHGRDTAQTRPRIAGSSAVLRRFPALDAMAAPLQRYQTPRVRYVHMR